MAIQHFSHEHPLLLIDVQPVPKNIDGGKQEQQEVVCYGCQNPITSSAYNCNNCNYFLHKKCGQLPLGIKHPKHPQHPLTLIPHPPHHYSNCRCNVCGISGWKWFVYHCSECEFDAHVSCSPLEERTDDEQHKFHDHPLTFMQREASFFCDACGTEGQDLSYRCTSTSCQFWVHDRCASSLQVIKRNDHHHSLELAYSIPHSKRNFDHYCYICNKIVHPTYWVYYCPSCRYFTHLKCATSKEQPLMLSDSKFEENLDPDIIHFPMPDEESLFGLMIQILRKKNSSSKGSVMVDTRIHNCQYYTLIDFEVERSKEMENKEKLCDVCIRPISFPFDTCSRCSFIMHTSCSLQLALQKENPDHPEHPIDLSCPAVDFNYRYCSSCGKYSNSFCNECTKCTSFLGVCCAATCLQRITIKHEAHEHPLLRRTSASYYVDHHNKCAACGERLYYGDVEYQCSTCNFHLEIDCAKLPGTVKHEWDRHPLSLTYPPFDHPDDYFCEICEEDIHPNHWLYHCGKCDQSFHTKCVCPPADEWSSVKFGHIYKFEHHSHNLTFVPRGKKKSSSCYHCGQFVYWGWPVLECTTCSFQMCIICAGNAGETVKRVKFPVQKKTEFDISWKTVQCKSLT